MPATDPAVLREFLALHDARCPTCNYSLRGLHGDTCPECSEPLELGIDDGPLLDHGTGPRALALAWVALALCGAVACVRAGNLAWFAARVGGQMGSPVWLRLALYGLVAAGAARGLILSRRARTPSERTARVVRWALVVAIGTSLVDVFFLTLNLLRL